MTFQLQNYQLLLDNQALFQPLSARVSAGTTLAISGPSGAGKSTLLADIAGILPARFRSSGTLLLNQQDLRPLSIAQRRTGILFQEDLLFPHLNVYQNMVFGLPNQLTRKAKKTRIANALEQAGLGGFENRDIATLSGGQRSRISLLRTLLAEPDLILLDEPFAKLDQSLRQQFRQWVFRQLAEQSIPAVLVTHDHDDIPPNNSQTIHLEPLTYA